LNVRQHSMAGWSVDLRSEPVTRPWDSTGGRAGRDPITPRIAESGQAGPIDCSDNSGTGFGKSW
jgi:hypothetical protein